MRTTTNEKLEKVITDIENTKAEIEKSKEKIKKIKAQKKKKSTTSVARFCRTTELNP